MCVCVRACVRVCVTTVHKLEIVKKSPHFLYRALTLNCIANFYTLFLVTGFIWRVGENYLMLILNEANRIKNTAISEFPPRARGFLQAVTSDC